MDWNEFSTIFNQITLVLCSAFISTNTLNRFLGFQCIRPHLPQTNIYKSDKTPFVDYSLTMNVVNFIFQIFLYNKNFHFDCFDNTIIVQMDITWSDHSRNIKYCIIIVGGYRIQSVLGQFIGICFISHYNSVINNIFSFLRSFLNTI